MGNEMEKEIIEKLQGCTNDGIWIYNANGDIIAVVSRPETRDLNEPMAKFIADAINEKIEKCKQIETYMDNCKKFGEMKLHPIPVDKFPESETKYTVQNIPPIELKNLKKPE